MRTKIQQEKDTLKASKSQQLELPLGITYLISDDEPVRQLWEVLEGMNFTAYEKRPANGRTPTWSAQELFAIWTLGTMNGIYSSRKLEEACRNDIRFMWLLEGKPAPDHTVLSRFRQHKLPEMQEGLFGQLVKTLYDLEEIDYDTVFIDGTKLEANANRYSFVWRKSIEKNLAKLKEKAGNALKILGVEMPASIDALNEASSKLRMKMKREGIASVHGKGRHKSVLQRNAEQLEQISGKWQEYERKLAIMGNNRNSFAKTDPDATFMRMKEDHMRNGQLKPAYNIQLAVNSEYIVGYGVFSNRTDSGTLKPLLKSIEKAHGREYKSVTADAGYESLENYTYLDKNEQLSFIKPINYEQRKKKSTWVGRMEDMSYDEEMDSFKCKNDKELTFSHEINKKSATGFVSKCSVYRCRECQDCPLRQNCSKAQQQDAKTIEVCWDFVKKREASFHNITSELGIQYRVNRSIQSEGTFGVLKQDWGFRRFLTRGTTNVIVQIALLAFAFNIRKLHTKRKENRTGTQLFEVNIA